MKVIMTAFWDKATCSLVEVDGRFRGDTSVYFYETTRHSISESRHLQTRRRENLKSQHVKLLRWGVDQC
jgi:hypothetical protein